MTLYLHDKYIIKASDERDGVIYGYDLLTENFVAVRSKDCQRLPECIFRLIGNEQAKAVLAIEGAINDEEAAKTLGVSVRTLYRTIDRYGIYTTKTNDGGVKGRSRSKAA